MSDDEPRRQFLIGDGFAVSCEFDPTTNTFDFAVSDGSRKAVSFPEATADEVAKAIKDIESCCPLARKG
jgi:hypothetical protein